MRSGSPAITVEFWSAGVGGVSDRPVLCDKGYNERRDTEVNRVKAEFASRSGWG